MSEAEVVFSKAASKSMMGFGKITSPRKTAEICINAGISEVIDYSKFLYKEYMLDEKLMKASPKEMLDRTGGIDKFAKDSSIFAMRQLESFIDNSSLIFAHSILDDILLDYCRASALADYKPWVKFIRDKTITFSKIIDQEMNDIVCNRVYEYVETLEKESMMVKNDKLFEVCKIDKGFSLMSEYKFDRNRLSRLDKLRHEIVHKSDEIISIPSINDDLWYLQQTAMFYMRMVNYTYGLQIDPATILSHAFNTTPSVENI